MARRLLDDPTKKRMGDVIKKAKERKSTQNDYDALSRKGLYQRKPKTIVSGGLDTASAAPRVGGSAPKSTTRYTGQGAVAGAKKLKKAGTKNKAVRSISRSRA